MRHKKGCSSSVLSRIADIPARWKWVLAYTALLLLTLNQTRRFLNWLAEHNLSGFLGIALFLAGVGCLLFVLYRIRRVRGGFTASSVLRVLAMLGLYMFCMLTTTDLTADRIHFVQYGILGILCFRAVQPSHRTVRRVAYATVVVFAIGLLDEGIQGLLDGRYFDVRDIVIDLLAGLLPVLGLLWLPLYAKGAKEGPEPEAHPAASQAEASGSGLRASDGWVFLVALCLLFAVLWVARVSWDLEPLYGKWIRENHCGRTETIQVLPEGTILWRDDAGGTGRGAYRIRGNRLDGPLLDVDVLAGKGSDACSWTTGEVRHRYFRLEPDRLVFTKEREHPFRRADPSSGVHPAHPPERQAKEQRRRAKGLDE